MIFIDNGCRKSKAKKVVCVVDRGILSGEEVAASELWVWRKYGQKPIKGSSYPRYIYTSDEMGCEFLSVTHVLLDNG